MKKRTIQIRRTYWVILTAVFVPGLTGCFRAAVLDLAAIEQSNEENIVVSIKDGRQVSFDSHQYSLDVDTNGRQVIRGRGKVYRQGESQFDLFEGGILIEDVEKISTSEKTTMFYVTVAAATLAVGYALIWVIALNGRGFGG